MKRKYHSLWDANIATLSNPKTIRIIFDLAKALKKLYPHSITDTLLTKILLGTVGCTPAYDKFFQIGCRKQKVRFYTSFSERSLISMIKFYQANCGVFSSTNETIKRKSGISYPTMKLVDMFFWSVGSNQNYYRIEKY
jgi:hypothetical protein